MAGSSPDPVREHLSATLDLKVGDGLTDKEKQQLCNRITNTVLISSNDDLDIWRSAAQRRFLRFVVLGDSGLVVFCACKRGFQITVHT